MSVRLVERRKNSLPIERALFSVLWEEEGLSLCNNNRKYALFLCEITLLTLSDLIKLLVHANHRHSIKDTFSHETGAQLEVVIVFSWFQLPIRSHFMLIALRFRRRISTRPSIPIAKSIIIYLTLSTRTEHF